jgi:CBS domain containing-hemolysin-like protein
MVALMGSLLRIYQMILYPAAKPTSMNLDWWLGKEGIQYFSERDLCIVTRMHVEEDETEIEHAGAG